MQLSAMEPLWSPASAARPRSLAVAVVSEPVPRAVAVTSGTSIEVGREVTADLVLDDDRVSRRHLRVSGRSDGVWVEDLGSKNGSMLNGQPFLQGLARAGDVIVIGATVLEIQEGTSVEALPSEEPTRRPAATIADPSPWLLGRLEEIPLFVVLQILALSGKSGLLEIRGPRVARIHLVDGQVIDASVDGLPTHARKAFFRALSWQGGVFELRAAEPTARAMYGSTEELLLEGHRHLDELRRLTPRLPGPNSCIVPGEADRTLTDLEAELVNRADRWPALVDLVDAVAAPDLEVAETLSSLLARGVLSLELAHEVRAG